MKNSVKELLIRLLILLCGLIIAHIGVSLFLLSAFGTDPFNVLVQGLHQTLSGLNGMGWLTHGYTHIAVCLLIIIALLFIDKSYIKLGTLVCMVCGGPIIDVCMLVFGTFLNESTAAPLRLLCMVLGNVILAFGMTIVVKSNAGTGPNDLVSVVIFEKTKLPFWVVKVIADGSFISIGWLLGGSVGIGTVACTFLVGPIAGVLFPRSERIVAKIVGAFVPATPKTSA